MANSVSREISEEIEEMSATMAKKPEPTTATQTSVPTETSLKTRTYRSWLVADTGLMVGAQLRTFAIPLIAFAATLDVARAGWITTAGAVASGILSIFSGAVIDRHNRRNLMLIYAISSIIIWSFAATLLITGKLNAWWLLGFVVLHAIISELTSGASDAYLRSIIDITDYPQARSINEGRDAAVNMISGPIGGVLYALANWLPFVASAITFFASFVATILIPGAKRESQRAKEVRKQGASFKQDFIDGWEWTFSKHTLVWCMMMTGMVNLGFLGLQEAAQLHMVSTGTSSQLIGLMDAVWGFAVIIGAVVATKIAGTLHVGRWSIGILIYMVACFVILIFTDNYFALMAAFSLSCIPLPLLNAMTTGYIFAKVPENMQGRVGTALGVPTGLIASFAAGIAGFLLKYLGWSSTIVVFIIILLLGLAAMIFPPYMRSIPEASQWETHELA